MLECKQHASHLEQSCRYEHPTADDLKAARAEWLLARKQRRQLVSWVEGNPHAFEAEKKGRRAAVLADWLVETFGKELLNSGSGVIPLTGGHRYTSTCAGASRSEDSVYRAFHTV